MIRIAYEKYPGMTYECGTVEEAHALTAIMWRAGGAAGGAKDAPAHNDGVEDLESVVRNEAARNKDGSVRKQMGPAPRYPITAFQRTVPSRDRMNLNAGLPPTYKKLLHAFTAAGGRGMSKEEMLKKGGLPSGVYLNPFKAWLNRLETNTGKKLVDYTTVNGEMYWIAKAPLAGVLDRMANGAFATSK